MRSAAWLCCWVPAAVVAQTQGSTYNTEAENVVAPIIDTVGSDTVQGFTTFQIAVRPITGKNPATNVYAVYGEKDNKGTRPMSLPAAFHSPAPIGVNIGGVNPAFFQIDSHAKYDSWLTVALTTGVNRNQISSIGIDWDTWTAERSITITDGAVFWMDPDAAPNFVRAGKINPIVLGQLTIKTGVACSAVVNLQGNGKTGAPDWQQYKIEFNFFAGLPSNPSAPPPPPPQSSQCDAVQLRLIQDAKTGALDLHSQPCSPSMKQTLMTALDGCTINNVKQTFGETFCISAASPPSLPPPPPVILPPAPACTMSTLQTRYKVVEAACCTPGIDDCTTGIPTTCAPVCRDKMLDFTDACRPILAQLPAGLTQIDEFAEKCRHPVDPGSLAQQALAALKQRKSLTFSCSYSELTGLALECANVPLSGDNSALCASGCVQQVLPFATQCASKMTLAFSTFGLQNIVSQAQQSCSAYDMNDCPLDHITKVCGSLTNPSRDIGLLCATPCVQTVSKYYAKCARSSKPAIVSSFSASNWKPLVETCAAVGGTAQDVKARCSKIEAPMMQSLSTLCCSDGSCSTLPTACSKTCSDQLLPFFRDCAAALLTTDNRVAGRITELAQLCSKGH